METYRPYLMSVFRAPIAPYWDAGAQRFHAATTEPQGTVPLSDVALYIQEDRGLKRLTETVRSMRDLRTAKSRLLPYVTPMAVLSRRNAASVVSTSGLVVIDFDKADAGFDLEGAKLKVFETLRQVRLAFVSPSGRGLKFFVDLGRDTSAMDSWLLGEEFHCLNLFISSLLEGGSITADEVGRDLCRACFLCHDPNALYRSSPAECSVSPPGGF